MKRIILILLLFAYGPFRVNAQYSYWFSSLKSYVGYNKNITLVGIMQDSLIFRNAVVHSGTSIWDISHQRFVAQLDSNYNMRWCSVLRGGIGEYEYPDMGVINDKYGNTYVGGPFRGFWWGQLFLTSTVSISNSDYSETIFLAKYDSIGNLIWYRQNKWGSNTFKFNMGIDSLDNVYLSTIGIDTVSFGADTLVMADTGVFVAKFDTSGNNVWVKELQGAKSVYDFQTDPAGNSFVVGNCVDTQYCGADTLYVPGNNAYMAKMSSSGSPQWQRVLKGGSYNVGCSVGIGPNGNPSFAGSFQDSLQFNTLPTLLSPATTANLFVAKYDSTGNEKWAIRSWPYLNYYFNFFSTSLAQNARVDGNNNTYIAGVSQSAPVHVDTSTVSFPAVSYEGQTKLVTKFDTAHNLLCTITLRNLTSPYITFDRDNYVYLVGRVAYPWYDNDIVINGDTIFTEPNVTTSYFYIAKFDQSCHLVHSERIGSPVIIEGIIDISEHAIKVYPIPTTDLLNITEVADKSLYRLINIAGTFQLQGTFDKGDNTISIGHLPPGMYYLQVISEDGRSKQVARIVKQ